MWPSNSRNINNIPSKQIPNEQPKNNIPESVPIYQTPIKQSLNIQRNNDTPVQFDFNFFFGNLWSSGHLPGHNVEIPMNMNNSVTQNNRETNMLLFKSSMEKSGYKLTPMSEIKNNNMIGCGLCDNVNDINNMNNIYENELNQNEFTKKNLTELFNNAKNDEFLQSTKKRINLDNNNINYYNNGNNYIISNNNINPNLNKEFNNLNFMNNMNNTNSNNYQINIEYLNEENKENKNPNNTSNISIKSSLSNNINSNPSYIINNSNQSEINLSNNNNEEMFNSPLNKKPKKIFECSGSTMATNSSKSSSRKRRFRKNNEQLLMLSQFFNEHKHWSKNQIKEISQKTGLKENKVYKWLWDQRNKEFKATKFIINKKNPP